LAADAGVRPNNPPVGAAGGALTPAAGFAPNNEVVGGAVFVASPVFAGSAGLAPKRPGVAMI
jgi:hypothetical protein